MKVKTQCEVSQGQGILFQKLYSSACDAVHCHRWHTQHCTLHNHLVCTTHLVYEWVNSLVTTMADGPTATVHGLPLLSTTRCRSTP